MQKRILIIDDDIELCREMCDILKCEGYHVGYSSTTEDAERELTSNAYDIILVDFKIPHSDGIDILKNVIRKSRKSKIFVTTGRPFIERLLQEHGLADEVSGVFSKPFDIKAMLQKIKTSTP